MPDKTPKAPHPPRPWPRPTSAALRRALTMGVVSGLTILAEVAFNVIGGPSGWVLGSGAALLLATPIGRAVYRHEGARTGLGGGRKAAARRLFLEQARLAWQDQMITRRERLLLEHLRQRLGLSHDEASRLEHEALRTDEPRAGMGPA